MRTRIPAGGVDGISARRRSSQQVKISRAFLTSRAICSLKASTEGNLISSRSRSRKQISTSVSGSQFDGMEIQQVCLNGKRFSTERWTSANVGDRIKAFHSYASPVM